MEKLVASLAEILEVEELDLNLKFTDYEVWDSLCILSILSLLDSDYHTQMTGKEILSYPTVGDFCKEVMSRQ